MTRLRYQPLLATTLVLALLTSPLALAGTRGHGPPPHASSWAKGKAARTVGSGTHDFHGERITCQAGEDIGLLVEATEDTEITAVEIQDCSTGIVVLREEASTPVRLTLRQASVRGAKRLTREKKPKGPTTVAAPTIGFLGMGDGGLIEANLFGDVDYGIVLMGSGAEVIGNEIIRARLTGILLAGGNEARIEENTIRESGVGIELVPTTPAAMSGHALPGLVRNNFWNGIRWNVLTDNDLDLREVSTTPGADRCWWNAWEHNQATTAQPACLITGPIGEPGPIPMN